MGPSKRKSANRLEYSSDIFENVNTFVNRSKKSVMDFNKHGFKCFYTNVDSFLNKLDEFKSRFLSDENQPDLIAITEVISKRLGFLLTKQEINL